jgi:hypothetical protein
MVMAGPNITIKPIIASINVFMGYLAKNINNKINAILCIGKLITTAAAIITKPIKNIK